MLEVCLSIVVGHSQLICHTLLVQSSVYYLCQRQLKRTFTETVSQLLRVLLVIFRYTVGTHVSIIIAYSDFTSRSPDNVLSKAGLFSTKLSLPELCYFYANESTLHKVTNF